MQYLLSLAFLIGLLGFQDTQQSPTNKDYENVLNHYKKIADNSLDVKSWQETKMVNSVTKEKKLFKELDEIDQYMFCLSKVTNTANILLEYSEIWNNELKKFNDPNYVVAVKSSQKNDVEGYIKELLDLRKDYAVKSEKFVEDTMDKFRDIIPLKERELFIKEIRDFNDEHKLVERK